MIKKSLQKIVENKKIRIFLFFLLISTGSLVLNKFSKEYKTTLSFIVVVNNIPANKILLKQPDELVKIEVKASGFNLIAYKILNRKIKINVNMAKLVKGTTYKIETNKMVDDFQKQLLNNTEIIEIINLPILIEMGKMIVKKIPVKLISDISFEKGYKMKGLIKLFPDSVLILGPEDKIAKINYVETNKLILKNIYEDFEEELDLKYTLDLKSVTLINKNIKVMASVEKFTEITFLIPFKIINNHKKLRIETFPSKVKLVFQAELSQISKIDESSFELVCDFENTIQQNLNYLVPKLIKKPTSVQNFYLEPSKIDFIIKK